VVLSSLLSFGGLQPFDCGERKAVDAIDAMRFQIISDRKRFEMSQLSKRSQSSTAASGHSTPDS